MEVRCGVCVVERVMEGWCESVCGRGGEGRLACVGVRGVRGLWGGGMRWGVQQDWGSGS